MFSVILNLIKRLYIKEGGIYDSPNSASVVTRKKPIIDITSIKENAENQVNYNRNVRQGTITFLSDEYGLIDDSLYFDRNILPKKGEFHVGDCVTFTSVNLNGNETERISSIETGEEEFDAWIESDDSECKNSFTNSYGKIESRYASFSDGISSGKIENRRANFTERVLCGKISSKEGLDIVIDELGIKFNLKDIYFDFVPFPGDWVSLTVQMPAENSKDLTGELCYVTQIAPILCKSGKGLITYVKPSSSERLGLIENHILFSRKFCDVPFNPSLGDQVNFKAIESDQGTHKWRAVFIEPVPQDSDYHLEKAFSCPSHVQISGDCEIGPMELGDKGDMKLTVKNKGNESLVLVKSEFEQQESTSQIALKSPRADEKIVIEPNSSVNFIFNCRARFLGVSSQTFTFFFEEFKVAKRLVINVSLNKKTLTLMEPKEKGPKRNKSLNITNFDLSNAIYADRAIPKSRFTKSYKLKSDNSVIPCELFKILLGDPEFVASNCTREIKKALEKYAPYVTEPLNPSNYAKRLHASLYLEEFEQTVIYKKYDRRGVTLKKMGKHLACTLSNLDSEMAIFPGSQVVVSQPWSEVNNGKHVGFVMEVTKTKEVLIRFDDYFMGFYDGSACDISFLPNRVSFVRSHAAINLAVSIFGMSWLFPTAVYEKEPWNVFSITEKEPSPRSWAKHNIDKISCRSKRNGTLKIKWFNDKLNDIQKQAIINVLEGRGRPLPYIIFGPPGTGKTATTIELLLQIYHLFSDSRMIVGTPSNSAADLICLHLIQSRVFTPGEMVRAISSARLSTGNVPKDLLPYCICDVKSYQDQFMPSILNERQPLGMQRLVVGTCSMLGMFLTYEHFQGRFTHVIIDEAGQTSEPEALIPICLMDRKIGQVILAGDTEQLGPVFTSKLAKHYQMTDGLLYRLGNTNPYKKNSIRFPETKGFDPRVVTRLQLNYRSVPEILQLPNKLFYDSELIPVITQTESVEADLIRKFNFAVNNRGTPAAIIFHGLRGECLKKDGNTSWYNPLEIHQVVNYLKKLYSIQITSQEVGIITPYKQQGEKIKHMVSKLKMQVPKIGSVEEFQGEERYAIILSTVRGSEKLSSTGNNLGFLACPRRLNVAITRARAILIIVGDPFTLSTDIYWKNVIKYCYNIKSYIGCSLDGLFKNENSKEEAVSEVNQCESE